MKILLCNKNYYHCGGVETLFFYTGKLLKAKEHTVIPFSLKSPENYESEFLEYFPSRPRAKFLITLDSFYSFKSAAALQNAIDKFKPDIAHIHNINGGITFSILPVLKKNKIPIVATIHGFKYLCPVWEFYNRKHGVCEKCAGGKYYNCILRNCSARGRIRSIMLAVDGYFRDAFLNFRKYFDYFLFVSAFTRSKFINLFPEIEKRSEVLYNFTEEIEDRITVPSGKIFLYVGRIEYAKGVDILAEVFGKMVKPKLEIAGEGSLYNVLKNSAKSNIKFLGRLNRSEIREKIIQSYFVIIPSRVYENNPYAVIEAFASGRPVIAPDAGGIPEIVENGKNGFLYKANDIDALTDSIYKAYELEEREYAKMCERALQTAKNKFNPVSHYESLIRVYEKTAKAN
ncbi:glycosyltransferase family 4 protein [Melioribacter sp. Ez-97]|uniref:glycosyltransferase family 4 protein n=1 Tax=Melioribacter sp. Ez-97 TaxID=3423434 RepID=UPI003EDA0AFF